jgi:hypothetical protein
MAGFGTGQMQKDLGRGWNPNKETDTKIHKNSAGFSVELDAGNWYTYEVDKWEP